MKPLMPEHTLPVMEAFYTVQGEGAYAGSPAYFIRLGGCDVGCHWCDVKESWDADAHPKQSISSIVEEAIKSGGKIVVVTGGEPLMYNLDELTAQLKSAGLRTHIETSGAYPLSGQWDWICFSPKKFKAPVEEFYRMASELKVIVYHRSDLSWAEGHAAKMYQGCKLYLQPEWSREKEMVPLIVEHVKKNPRWNISLQTHKYMNIP
jgi:7-carboxy-7-deazaguanine synthase